MGPRRVVASFRHAFIAAGVVLLLVGASARSAQAHIPPPLFLTIDIDDARTDVAVVLHFDVFEAWVGRPGATLEAPGTREATRAVLQEHLSRWLRLRVDGVAVESRIAQLEIQRFEDHLETWEFVKVGVRIDTPVAPKQMAFAWLQYAAGGGHAFMEVDCEVDARGELSYPVFREREPEYVWHRPRAQAAWQPPPLPPPAPPRVLSVPIFGIALVLLSVLALALGWRRLPRHVRPVLPALGIGLGYLCMGVGTLAYEVPGSGGLRRPDADGAVAVFASLHRGAYGALDGETEDEVYDQLARSVTGGLLPRLYMDIHESMILEKEGGAVARVQKTEILDVEVLPEGTPEDAWFKVRARWRVHGKVGHWGHTHQRINEYLADVTVVAAEDGWKLADIQVLDQTREDDGTRVR